MKINRLNLGKVLTREEQKQIKGGELPCALGNFIYCDCNGRTTCIPSDGNTPQHACVNWCTSGTASTPNPVCITTCPGA